MEIILLDKIANLGGLGDKVTVKSGYGRNFLFPQGKAVPATKANVEKFEARRAELEAKIAELGATTKTDSFYSQPYEQTQSVLNEIQEATTLLETSMARWVELEEQQQNFLALKKQGR